MEEIVKETKYMRFELTGQKPKTNIYTIFNKKSDEELGEISWYSYWRQYVFEPAYDCLFNHTCLKEISEFLTEINKNHKEKKNQGL